MGLFNLPILGNSLLFPTILTSLIVGFMFLILSERKRVKGGSESRGDARTSAKGTTEGASEAREAVEEDVGAGGEAAGGRGEGEGAKGESSCCSSGSEEDLGEKKKPKKKKHSCEGAKACSSKKTVSEVLLWTDEGEQSEGCVEEFTSSFVTGGLGCSTCLLLDESRQSLSFLEGGPTSLNLFMLTSTETCDELINTLLQHTRKDDGEKANFIYSIVCLAESSSDQLLTAARRLNDELAEQGGTEWLPPACISSSDQEPEAQEVLSPPKYTTQVLNKVKKISKKCCGTSCGTKKSVDIEDLAASLLPAITPVKT
ncbi:uncharacterized protein LOC125026581 [Penaeus chinensis]|uniref:uncharacterized protein LOC125026581 n=1 Tax=Penaeus chinensis TaxID=139456 RepID=UPI001FB6CB8E|nr:uncharacterized protein LOC125026581 [Penaeus chinensis]XP_047471087.1 uncharacterized protein LOC125026581 [Penaeus chinensis]XP_047471098.1 uncharacterized protein LOC125026581 [Penaeus chinensis]XP_047471106.1 uncharacterized protein LOC125026581 [Penaeus chinensis]